MSGRPSPLMSAMTAVSLDAEVYGVFFERNFRRARELESEQEATDRESGEGEFGEH